VDSLKKKIKRVIESKTNSIRCLLLYSPYVAQQQAENPFISFSFPKLKEKVKNAQNPFLNSDKVVWVGGTNSIARYNAKTGQFISNEACHKGMILRLIAVEDKVWSASHDKNVGIFDGNTGQLLKILQGHTGPILDITLVGDYIWTTSWDKSILVWNKNTFECNTILSGHHTDMVTCVSLVNKKNGHQVWTGSGSVDGSVCIFKILTKVQKKANYPTY